MLNGYVGSIFTSKNGKEVPFSSSVALWLVLHLSFWQKSKSLSPCSEVISSYDLFMIPLHQVLERIFCVLSRASTSVLWLRLVLLDALIATRQPFSRLRSRSWMIPSSSASLASTSGLFPSLDSWSTWNSLFKFLNYNHLLIAVVLEHHRDHCSFYSNFLIIVLPKQLVYWLLFAKLLDPKYFNTLFIL